MRYFTSYACYLRRALVGLLALAALSAGRLTAQQPATMSSERTRPTQLQQLNIGDICRLKGQERNTLQGMGLVTGLNGTGDGAFGPTARSLIRAMDKLKVPVAGDAKKAEKFDPKNVALVMVTADIPVEGARQGDEFDCTVTSVNAKSLQGGYLMMTPLVGPIHSGENAPDPVVYAVAQGLVRLDDKTLQSSGKISAGCRVARNVMNPFVKDDKITLVIDRSHAQFRMAKEIEDAVNFSRELGGGRDTSGLGIAHAIDQLTVEVQILEQYRDDPVEFAALVLQQELRDVPHDAVVVVNETTGVITMSADLELAPTALTHQNITIDIGGPTGVSEFVGIDPAADSSVPTLKALVQSMNALRVSAKDMIQIIRELESSGAIYGHVIYR
jgi:flagellar P-ring protein FlgI